ncbi:MAG: class I SAM-dependent methyltransferase [Psychroflexus sp.]|nr:class I SAM-dependent methyltransferase [Psychroflexus sp.]
MKVKEKVKKPWPTKKAMIQIYEKNLWGGSEGEFYSGEGSHASELLDPYLKSVSAFLKSFQIPLSVCDLGCGDFNVGQQLIKYTKAYTAIDIVPDLIEFNQHRFKNLNVKFECLNITEAQLPKADCVIIRQVLQHLSNKEIKAIVNRLYAYKYVILTEHLPNESFVPNKDIISGQGIRFKKNSAVDLLAEPFHLKMKSKQILTKTLLNGNKACLVTTLYQIF